MTRPYNRLRRLLFIACALSLGCSDDSLGPIPAGPLTARELYQACIRTSACLIKAQPRISNCVDYYQTLVTPLGLQPIYDTIYRCVNQAGGDCTQIFDCFGSHPAAGGCDQTFAARCDGPRAVTCDLLDQRVYRYDCRVAGLGCEVKQGQSAFEASCTVGRCEPGTYTRRCEGGRLLSCYQGVIVVDDCARQSLACITDNQGARCAGTSNESCETKTFKPTCEGSVARQCLGGRVNARDCGAQPILTRCQQGVCVASGTECGDQFNRCQGQALEACTDGRWQRFDCGALGLAPCETRVHGAACGGN